MRRLVAGLVAAAVLGSAPAFADKPDKPGKSKAKAKGQDAAVVVTFTVGQRDTAQAYFVEKHGRGGCPPGLAKKNNGCLPPGQAKKRYAVGQPLPQVVVVERVPTVLVPRLRTAPPGYEYVWVDGDVLLMETRTRRVADAIAALLD
jgi:hypothetical protein